MPTFSPKEESAWPMPAWPMPAWLLPPLTPPPPWPPPWPLKGSLLVNYSPLPDHGLPSFFRPVIIQPKVQDEDLLFMLDEIDRIGSDL